MMPPQAGIGVTGRRSVFIETVFDVGFQVIFFDVSQDVTEVDVLKFSIQSVQGDELMD